MSLNTHATTPTRCEAFKTRFDVGALVAQQFHYLLAAYK
jgi:hypothetical protein